MWLQTSMRESWWLQYLNLVRTFQNAKCDSLVGFPKSGHILLTYIFQGIHAYIVIAYIVMLHTRAETNAQLVHIIHLGTLLTQVFECQSIRIYSK